MPNWCPRTRIHLPVALAADLALLRLDFLVGIAVFWAGPEPPLPFVVFPVPGLVESVKSMIGVTIFV